MRVTVGSFGPGADPSPMYEVEVKLRTDHAPLRRRLDEAGADRLDAVRQEDVYYDAPHRQFASTDEALRLRRERRAGEWHASLAYKGPRVDERSKTRSEAETAVEDAGAAQSILEGLGFEPAATVVKERERYALDGYTIALDDVEGLGTFVEVERTVRPDEDGERAHGEGTGNRSVRRDEGESLESAVEGAHAVLRRLGLDPAAQIRTSYLGLLLGNNPD